MSFGPHHYVPTLKVKRGEKAALSAIAPELRPRITPLLEIVERNPAKTPTIEKHLNTAFQKLADAARLYERCFLDTQEIAPDGPEAAVEVFRRATAASIAFIPVTGLSRTVDLAAAVSYCTHGLALRLTRKEFEQGQIRGLASFIGKIGLRPEQIDLIVDLGEVSRLVEDGVTALTSAFLADVPDHGRWRSLTVTACAFPLSMAGVARNSSANVDRAEWMAWRNGLHASRHKLSRLPTFGDSTIQHPRGVEGFDPRIMQVSAAVRLTCPGQWLLIKGQSTRTKPPSQQFPELARKLVYGSMRPRFAGASHCKGCRGMKAAADGAPNLGSAETWRRLGTIHHVTSVMDGLAALPWP